MPSLLAECVAFFFFAFVGLLSSVFVRRQQVLWGGLPVFRGHRLDGVDGLGVHHHLLCIAADAQSALDVSMSVGVVIRPAFSLTHSIATA